MPGIIASMDASLIPLAASLPGTMPSKVYEALASGIPIVVTAGCEADQLVRRYNVGKVFDPADSEQVAAAITQLASDQNQLMQIRGSSTELARRFDRNKITELAEELILAVAHGRPLPKVEW
jgi:glycosyltransferase involved in cell wall biosynthesis